MMSVKTSRWAELATGHLTSFVFPKTISIGPDGIQTVEVRSLIFPWIKEEERMALSRVASIRHIQGMLWDTVIIDVLGAANVLDVKGLKKSESRRLVDAIHQNLTHLQMDEVAKLAKLKRLKKTDAVSQRD